MFSEPTRAYDWLRNRWPVNCGTGTPAMALSTQACVILLAKLLPHSGHVVGIPVQGRHVCYRWDGSRVDSWLVYGEEDWRPLS